jgi:osmotically-inducible protein OsmY
VKLSGAVRSKAEEEAAENDASYVWGVREVVNELSVAS